MSTKKARMRKALSHRKTWGALKTASGVLVFLSSLTAKDSAAYSGKSIGQKLGTLVNNIFGRITGFNPVPSAPSFPQTINTNINDYFANPWMKLSLGGIGYAIGSKWINRFAGRPVLKHGGKVGSIASTTLFSSVIGTLFDAPSEGVVYQTNGAPQAYYSASTVRSSQ